MTSTGAIRDLELYHYPLSRSLRVLHMLYEVDPSGASFKVRRLKLMEGEGYSKEFLALNPFHAVPVVTFKIEGEPGNKTHAMPESTAILRFLAQQFEAEGRLKKPLVPRVATRPGEKGDDPAVVADWERWFAFVSTTMDAVLWEMRVINDFRGAKPEEKELLGMWCDKWNNEINPALEARFAQLAAAVAEKEGGEVFASPWGFSILDCVMMQTLNWSVKYVRAKLIDPPGPHTRAYAKRISSRPAFKKATEDSALFEKDGGGAKGMPGVRASL